MPTLKKVKLPNNTTVDINDARVVSDGIVYIGDEAGSATYESEGIVIDLSNYQPLLVSGTNIKTINNQSLLGSGNISISGGGGGGGEENVIESISVNGTPQTVVDKNVDLSIPAEITTTAFIGSFERTNVSGSGNVTIYNTVGYFPAVPGDGSYEVTTYAKSSTTSYTLSVTFGSNSYSLTSTDGEISDTRTLTLQSGESFKVTITSVASGTTVGAIVNLPGSVVTSVGKVAVSNNYNDLYNLPSVPTISTSVTTDATSDTKASSPKSVKTYVDSIVGDIETLLAAI